MKKYHQITSALLAMMMLMPSLASCNTGETDQPETESSADTAAVTETTAPEETEPLYSEALPAQSFDGATVRIAAGNMVSGLAYPILLNFATELNGEIVNDALYERDLWLEEKYQVDLTYEETSDWDGNKFKNGITAGDCPFEIVLEETERVCTYLSMNGLVYPLNMVDGIQLDAPYWFPELNDIFWMGEDLYIPVTAISPRLYGSAGILIVNRDLMRDINNLPDLYESVKEGTWTMDLMQECVSAALMDLDGNGVYDYTDQHGLVFGDMTHEALVIGAGQSYLKNNDGELQSMIENEGMYDLIKKIEGFLMNPSSLDWCRSDVDYDYVYSNGNYLFLHGFTMELEGMRDFDYDFGILPFPKADEDQEGYYSYANPWVTDATAVPATVQPTDLPMTGTILNAMVAYGYDHIRPVTYETVLKYRNSRDEATAEIVDMLFDNVIFSVGAVLWNTQFLKLLEFYSYDVIGTQEITSFYAGFKQKSESENMTTMEKFAEIHEKFAQELGK